MCMRHMPVLLNEVLASLQLKSGMNAIDCTLGDAGHAEKILEATSPNGKLLGIDADPEAVLRAKQFLYSFEDRVICARDNFTHLQEIIEREKFYPMNAILFDLGWSTPQFEERGRGFSFAKDEPLDMRYEGKIQDTNNKIQIQTAADIVNESSVHELGKIFKGYGEEGLSKEIAKVIVEQRKKSRIERTGQLVEIILEVYRQKLKTKKEIPWVGGLHPATKVFQALRIAVNDELGVLEKALPQAVEALEPGGRIAVISFHSLEDRIVKHFFKGEKRVKIITKKPIVCSAEEYEGNPRARSAKLRVAEKL